MTRLPGEQPLFDIIPFERERLAANAERDGRTLSQQLILPGKSIDLATATIHAAPLFAAFCEPTRRLFTDF